MRPLLLILVALVLLVDPDIVAAKVVKTLEDGRTGTLEFESLTYPLSSGPFVGLAVPDQDAKVVVVSPASSRSRGAPHGCRR